MHLDDKNRLYATFTVFRMKYLVVCKVYTDVGGIKQLFHVCPPVRKIIHSLKLVDYLHVQADNPWYKYYVYFMLLAAYLTLVNVYVDLVVVTRIAGTS